MDDGLTVEELQQRWENALVMTLAAVARQPGVYGELKSLAGDILNRPVDISEYLPAVRKLAGLLEKMDPCGRGTIFHFFNERIGPASIWDVCWLRVECKDLLAHLNAFEQWRLKRSGLKVVK